MSILRRPHLALAITTQGSRMLNYPWTKTKGVQGDHSIPNCQNGVSDPIAALELHLKVNGA